MDLFEFFKENESKLQERPSEQVWQKLEYQLKKNKKRPAIPRRGIRFLQTGIAALILILLLLTAILVWYFASKK